MKIIVRVFYVFVLTALLAACGTAPTPTATPAPTEAPTIAPTETAAPTATAESTPTEMAMDMHVADPFNVSVAQYFLDSAGFHGIATTLAEKKVIDATYLSTVTRVQKVLVHTTWPKELNDQAQAFIKSLGEFATALTDNKVDDAVKLSATVHDAQHELSHAIDGWAATAKPGMTDADPFRVSVAQYFLDSAGFHGMAETLASDKKIDTTYLSKVNRVKKVLVQTTWPKELKDQAQAFVKSLGEFATALEADKVDDAIKLSDTVHDAQHELSHAIDDWMASAKPASGESDPFNVSVAQYFLDSAGFHSIATTLAEKKTIDPTYLSTVNRVKKVLTQTIWPKELNDQAQAFIKSLGEFATALTDNKVDDAIKLADTVHDAQHELSHAIDGSEADAHNH